MGSSNSKVPFSQRMVDVVRHPLTYPHLPWGYTLSGMFMNARHYSGNSIRMKDEVLNYAVIEVAGRRETLQECTQVRRISSSSEDDETTLVWLAVFDGHGGTAVPWFCYQYMFKIFEAGLKELSTSEEHEVDDIVKALKFTFRKMDEQISVGRTPSHLNRLELSDHSGSTCTVAVVTPKHVVFAAVGDSQGAIVRNGKIRFRTTKFSPELDSERARIESTAKKIRNGRVYSEDEKYSLSISRSLGDFEFKREEGLELYKQAVISKPEVRVFKRTDSDDFIFIASDGMWDYVHGSAVASYLQNSLEKGGKRIVKLAKGVACRAYSCGSADNISFLMFMLKSL